MITLDEIRAGLTDGEFFLEYMPTVSLVDGRCVGAEALSRWRRASGLVQPDEFIGLVEGTHLAGMLTYWVFETVAKELGDWLRAHKDAHIGVNVPPELLGRGALEWVAAKTGLAEIRDQIIIELTERGIPDSLGVAALEAVSRSGYASRAGRRHPDRDQLGRVVTMRPGPDQDRPIPRGPNHSRLPPPCVARWPLVRGAVYRGRGHLRGSGNRGAGPGPARGRDSDGAGVLLFSPDFRRRTEGVHIPARAGAFRRTPAIRITMGVAPAPNSPSFVSVSVVQFAKRGESNARRHAKTRALRRRARVG